MASSEWLFTIWQKHYSSFLLIFHQSSRIYGQECGQREAKCNYSVRDGKSTYRNKNATFRGNHRSTLLVSNVLFSLFYTWKTQSLLLTPLHLSRETPFSYSSRLIMALWHLCSRSLSGKSTHKIVNLFVPWSYIPDHLTHTVCTGRRASL